MISSGTHPGALGVGCQRPRPISGCDSTSRRYSHHSLEAPLLELHAETHWPRGLGLLWEAGRGGDPQPARGGMELARLKRLIESNPQA